MIYLVDRMPEMPIGSYQMVELQPKHVEMIMSGEFVQTACVSAEANQLIGDLWQVYKNPTKLESWQRIRLEVGDMAIRVLTAKRVEGGVTVLALRRES